MKIMHIVGNRPQFIKLAMLYRELEKRQGPGIILHTGQHFDSNMSNIFFEELDIPAPNHDLAINQMTHNELIGNMLIGIDRVLEKEKPGLVIVYGDTNTTLAGALASRKRNISLAHVEAGIRTGNETMPEETNRYLTDRMSQFNFSCTGLGLENLQKEGLSSPNSGHVAENTGDLMLDAIKLYGPRASERKPSLPSIDLDKPFLLATIHREENSCQPQKLKEIIEALNELHRRQPVLMPLHPKTKKLISQLKIPISFPTCEALGYLDMLHLLQKCQSVITDSGGLSREAFFLSKPVLVIMENPFWPEIFVHGNCLQAAAIRKDILEKQDQLLSKNKIFKVDIFGDGRAAEKISNSLLAAR